MENSYFYVQSYSYTNHNGNTKESNKKFTKNQKGEENFEIVERKNEKISKNIKGKKSKDSNDFTLNSNNKLEEIKMNQKEVYDMLAKELGLNYEGAIKEFLKSKDYKRLKARTYKKNVKKEESIDSKETNLQQGG